MGELNMWSVCVRAWIYTCTWLVTVRAASLQFGDGLCVVGKSSTNEHECTHNGTEKYLISYEDSGLFKLICNGHRVFEYDDLPRFESELIVPHVVLWKCSPPANHSLSQALAAFNVKLLQAVDQSVLSLELPLREPPLTKLHFADLWYLANLTLISRDKGQLAPSPEFLSPLLSLRSLKLQNVPLPPGALNYAPPSLCELILYNTGLQRLPHSVLSLPNLRILDLREKQLELSQEFGLPQTLTVLNLRSKKTKMKLDTIPAINTLTLTKWTDTHPPLLTTCGSLQKLQLNWPAVEKLPDGWVENCKSLTNLVLQNAYNLNNLSKDLLRGATALTHVTLMKGKLETIPKELFHHQRNLINLDLQNNHLHTIPSGTFAGSRALQLLDLSSNELTDSVWAVLPALHSLTDLKLAHNRRLGDACADTKGDYSKLNRMENLKTLNLMNTSVSRICVDWRERLPLLENLNLEHTAISKLRYPDLQFRNVGASVRVWLKGAPITSVQFSESDYEKSGTALTTGAVVKLGGAPKLACDCTMYWTWLALNKTESTNSGDACVAAQLPARCACEARAARGGRLLLRVRCSGAALTAVPRMRAALYWLRDPLPTLSKMHFEKRLQHENVMYELLLANNSISSLRGADLRPSGGAAPDLPHHFAKLDLTNNTITEIDYDATIIIRRQAQMRVLLAGNRLDCNCSAVAPLLRVLSASDRRAAACALAGLRLDAVRLEDCGADVPPAVWATGALLALLAVAATVVALLGNRERWLTLIVLLHKIGLLRRTDERDDDCAYDAFVSFSHEDEKIMCELVRRLESGPAPYRLCLHYRDWVPGRFIPDQIVESVRQSRRTLTLVSRHFLRSTWACAEFREAYAHAMAELTPRLVVVLLEEPAALPLDPRLRRYLRTNTYVRWGDPWFWDKLKLALPTPRAPPRGSAPSLVLVMDEPV